MLIQNLPTSLIRGQVTELFPGEIPTSNGVQRDRHKGLKSQSYRLFIIESRRHDHASTELTHRFSEGFFANLPQNLVLANKLIAYNYSLLF